MSCCDIYHMVPERLLCHSHSRFTMRAFSYTHLYIYLSVYLSLYLSIGLKDWAEILVTEKRYAEAEVKVRRGLELLEERDSDGLFSLG